jgi:hypothetical protein
MLAGAAILCLAARPGWAETHVLARAGGWEAFGGTTTSGRPVCGMSSSSNGRYFGLKFFSGDNTLTIQLGSNAWRVENGAKQKLQMRFDAESPWNATGTGMHFNDGDAGLEYTINRNELDEFMHEFRDSSRIVITFIGSNATAWSGSLAGTGAISENFARCMRDLR